MADKKITELTAHTALIDTDVAPVVDITAGETKKTTWANIKSVLKTYFDTLYALTGHNHSGVYEPIKGSDDNYVTNAEKIVIGNTSGTNSGDNAANSSSTYIGTTQVALNRTSAALTLAGITLTTPDIGTPSAGVLTSCTGLPYTGLADGTDGNLITWGADGHPAVVATGTSTHVLTSNGAGAAPTFQAIPASSSSFVLLKAGTGTSTVAVATTVDSIAITGLTALDTIVIYYVLESATQTTANPLFYNVTDAVALNGIMAGTLVAGARQVGHTQIQQGCLANTTIYSNAVGADREVIDGDLSVATATTAWTGNWTLGLRHGGVTAGGTFYWKWSVYKLLGQ